MKILAFLGAVIILNGCAIKVGYSPKSSDNRICLICIDAGESTVGIFGYDDHWGTYVYDKTK